MIRLLKNCIVREVATQHEADALAAMGYELLQTAPELTGGSGNLSGLTIPQLVQICQEKNIEIPKGTKKKEEFITLLVAVQEG